jgi:O-antigen/teichoic acid export membrane protein
MYYAESFINILYSSKYQGSILPFRILLFILPVRIAYYGSAYIAFGKTKIVLYRSVFDLILTAIFCYLLVLWLGAYAAALAMIITLYLWTIPYNLFTLSKSFNCKATYILPFKRIGKIFLISIISGLVSSVILFFQQPHVILFSLGAIIFGIIYLIMAYKFIPEFNETVRGYFKKIIYRIKYQ